ncbi:MAG: hypothetical protein IJQ66_07410 [Clostridia bacterium]|nr:hypothetical protein [Clostridia bacterium]
MEKVKRNLLLTLLAVLVATLSAVLFIAFAPSTAKADGEVKENVVAEKTVKEKIEDWKKSIGEEEFAKIVAKNVPSDSVDYSAYEKITDETITSLSGIIVSVKDFNGSFNDVSDDPRYTSSDPDISFQVIGSAAVVVFFYGSGSDSSSYMYMVSPLTAEESATFVDSAESTWLAYYFPHTVELTKMYDSTATPITVNVDDLTFNISNNRTDISFYGVSEASSNEPDNPTPNDPTPNDPTSGTNSNSHSHSSGSSGTSDTFIKVISVTALLTAVVVLLFLPSLGKKNKNRKK